MKLLRIGLLQVGTTQLIVAVDISGAKSIFVLLDYSTVTCELVKWLEFGLRTRQMLNNYAETELNIYMYKECRG